MAPLLAWYHARLQKTKLGTVLATTHFCILSLLLGGIVISPSRDWPWWAAIPFILDLPFSFAITLLSNCIRDLILILPHAGLERWLLAQREPFTSLDLFWLPAILYTVLGTLWHYYWPQLPKLIQRTSK